MQRLQRLGLRQFCTTRRRDIYSALAQEKKLRSRAAFKLEEINKKHRIFRSGSQVVDLGAAPGGFSVIASKHIKLGNNEEWEAREAPMTPIEIRRTLNGTRRKQGRLICVDLQEMDEVSGATFVRGDIRDDETHKQIVWALHRSEADVVLSDISPSTISDAETNHIRSIQLAESAFKMASELLCNGGIFVVKVFSGSDEMDFRSEVERRFVKVRTMKPAACRRGSREVYVVGLGFVPEHLSSNAGRVVEVEAEL